MEDVKMFLWVKWGEYGVSCAGHTYEGQSATLGHCGVDRKMQP